MAEGPSTSAAGRVIDRSLQDAREELKKHVKRLLIQNLKQRNGGYEGGNQVIPVASASVAAVQDWGKGVDVSDAQVARYLRERGYEYTLSVLMAEANVPDSKVLQSIATRLHDSRSQLLVGHPDFQNAILQVWEDTEKRYNEKLRNQIIDWEMKQTMQLKQMERMLRRRLAEEEQEMKRQISNRLVQTEAKEKEVEHILRERQSAFEQRIHEDKRQLLEDVKDLDEKRHGLQSLEAELRRQVDMEQNRIRRVKEDLNQLSLELKRQQMQLTFQMDDAVKEARRQEQTRYAEKLQQISKKEEKLREIIEKAKNSKGEMSALKHMLLERDSKLQELEVTIQHYRVEIAKSQDRLREREEALRRMHDYDIMKTETIRMKDEIRSTREEMTKEKRLLQQRNHELEAKCRDLSARIQEWNPGEENPFKRQLEKTKLEFEKIKSELKTCETYYRKQLEEEKSKNDQMKQKLDGQTERLQYLSEMVKKLHVLLAKGRLMNGASISRIRVEDAEAAAVTNVGDVTDAEEPTPDYLKEAKRRLRLLERETENFEESLQRYQRESIQSSSLAMWQAQVAAYPYGRIEGVQPRENRPISLSEINTTDEVQGSVAASIGPELSHFPTATQLEAPAASVNDPITKLRPPSHSSARPADTKAPPADTSSDMIVPEADDWEAKLRKREEERRQRDAELRRQQEEELKRMQVKEEPALPSTKTPVISAAEQRGNADASAASTVDPVLQKYMQMVLEQRQKELEQPRIDQVASESADEKQPQPMDESHSTHQETPVEREVEVDVGAVKAPSSDSDFEW